MDDPPIAPTSPPYPEPLPEEPVVLEAPRRWTHYGADALLGLGLLLGGVPLAWLLGLGASSLIVRPSQQVPFQEVMLRRTSRVITEIQRLPGRWQPAPPLETRIEPVPIPTQPLSPLTPPPAALNNRERQIAKEELAALQQEFGTIQKRLLDLESRLGQAQSTADIQSRLVNLEGRLNPRPSPSATLPSQPFAEQPFAEGRPPENGQSETTAPLSAPLRRPSLLEVTELKITLPSDALFAPGEARLLSTAPELLNSIFNDLTQYPQATILIGSHTDDRMEPPQSARLSFQQATVLRAYLSGTLPDHRWVTIGYGQSHPLTDNSSPQFRQRNRRVEIAIDRR